jgi:formamidopyrimidine-DNA glycosylase
MPELPEVTTTVNGLQKVLPKLSVLDVWTDLAKKKQNIKHFQDTLKCEKFFKFFKKQVLNKKVLKVERKAKNILIHLEDKNIILIHLKMTGHLLYGKYEFIKQEKKWLPKSGEKSGLFDPYNRFIHVVFTLSNNKHLVFCDSRKFGKVTLVKSDNLKNTKHIPNGLEPLDKSFKVLDLENSLSKKPNGKVKSVLMDQELIVGIGNIYSDEILWLSNIRPNRLIKSLSKEEFKLIYKNTKSILKKGIDFGGDSMSDYRNIYGEKGKFQTKHSVYQEHKKPCKKIGCTGIIEKISIGGRSAHFCPKHQI